MGWSSPATYTAGQVVGASDMNLIRDNLIFLLSQQTFAYVYQSVGADYTLSTTLAWTTIDGTNLAATIVSTTGRVRVTADFNLNTTAGNGDLSLDFLESVSNTQSRGNTVGVYHMVIAGTTSVPPSLMQSCNAVWSGLSTVASHTFTLQYYKTTGAVQMRRGGYSTSLFITEF